MPISMGSGRHGQIHLSSTIGAHNGGDKLRIGCAEADQPLTNLAKQTADHGHARMQFFLALRQPTEREIDDSTTGSGAAFSHDLSGCGMRMA